MDYSKRLRELGIKVTQHKLAVLELFANHKHLDALKIAKLFQQRGSEISLATIYRILASFEEHKLITKHNFSDEHASYELEILNEHHDHLICLKCSKVIEFMNNQIEDLQLQIAKQNKFILVSHTLNIYGTCENCNK